MQLEVFDVEHGACALLTTDNGRRIMIDCGHNASTGWCPGSFLRYERGVKELDLLMVTNYDEDHVSGLPDLLEHVRVRQLMRNQTVDAADLKYLKSEDGMGKGIDALADMIRRYTDTVSAAAGNTIDFPGVEYQTFRNRYPQDFDDENNLSMVVQLKVNGVSFLFPGDLETAGWQKLLGSNQNFRRAVTQTDVLFAAHHGRENGICDEIFTQHGCTPWLVVISDKAKKHQTQETVPYYGSKVIGRDFRGRSRDVLTTRNDGDFTFYFDGRGWTVD